MARKMNWARWVERGVELVPKKERPALKARLVEGPEGDHLAAMRLVFAATPTIALQIAQPMLARTDYPEAPMMGHLIANELGARLEPKAAKP